MLRAGARILIENSTVHLQARASAILGREQELAVARQRLARADVRLLTLTGPPGVGKTRLAVELASDLVNDFADGVSFVDLEPIGDTNQVTDAIARGLGLLERGSRAPADAVEDFLRDRSVLLILDNCEQAPDVARVVGRLLGTCPRLKVLATSRATLRLRWESLLPVPPLGLPNLEGRSPVDAVAASPAAQLFLERARAVSPAFVLNDADADAIAAICAHLDGLPLAIELAAARIKLFPPRPLLRRLLGAEQADALRESPLRFLAGQSRDLPPRQQTLLRALAWSYDLLGANEQALLQRLSVFVGGCTLEAAEAVGDVAQGEGLDAVGALVDKSLIWLETQPDGEPRLRMLETIAEYAREQLGVSGMADQTRARQAAYFVDLAERAAPELIGPRQQTWFARLERERDNLRTVERWAVSRGETEPILRLGAALWPFWLARGDASETRDRLAAILPLVDQVQATPAMAGAFHGAGLLAEKLGDYATCRALVEAALAAARQFYDARILATVLDSLGRHEFIEGEYVRSRALLEESQALLRPLDDRAGLARVLSHLGFLEYLEGRPQQARVIFEQGLALAREAEDQHRVAEFMDNLGNTFEVEGDHETAARMFQDAVTIWRELGQGHWLAMALNNLGKVQTQRGELGLARRHLREALSLAYRMGNRRRQAYILSAVAVLAHAEGRSERAVRLEAISAAAVAEIGARPAREPNARPLASVPSPPVSLEQGVEESLAWLAEQAQQPAQNDGLTRREREVVVLLARGLTNRQIGEALVVTEGTAENYVQRVLGKLGVSNRAQVAVWAVEHGLRNSER